jgi:hypothetical protein
LSFYLVWIDSDPAAITPGDGQGGSTHHHDNSLGWRLWALAERTANNQIFSIDEEGHKLAVIVQEDAP